MSFIHDYFGTLTTTDLDDTDVIWSDEVLLGERQVEVTLWASPQAPLEPALLDRYAQFLNRLAEADKSARQALARYLSEEADYINCHRQELDGGDSLPTDPEAFAAAMHLPRLSLWISADDDEDYETQIVLDYMIAPEDSDQILAVTFSPEAELLAVEWES